MRQHASIFLSWTAPVTSIKILVGITYCVNVANSTFPDVQLFSECGIIATQFNFTKPVSTDCHSILFTVFPVDTAGYDGERETVSYTSTDRKRVLLL